MPTLALFCSLCCASARHRLSHLRPSNLSFLFPPLNVVYEGRLTRWEAFKLQTYLVVRRGCWLYEDVQHVRFRAAVVTYVGHYGESGEDGGSTVQVRAAKGILSTSTRIFCSCHLGSKRAASVLIGFVVFHFLYRFIGFEEPLFG